MKSSAFQALGATIEASSEKVIVDGKLNLPRTTGDYDTYYSPGEASYAFRINKEVIADGIVFYGFGREGTPGGSAIGVNDNATRAGFPVRITQSGGMYFLMDDVWRSATDRYTTYTQAQAATQGIALDLPSLPDAWGTQRSKRRATLGAVNAPPPGFALMLR